MRVNISNVKEGCILAEDVFSITNRPIMKKKTVLSDEMIHILKAFLIQHVEVEKILINGSPFILEETIQEHIDNVNEQLEKKTMNLTELYLRSVQSYKKEFQSWQSGLSINIWNIRTLLLPLIDMLEGNTSELFSLHHLSTKDDYIYKHPVAVSLLCGFIAQKLNFSKGEIIQIALAGILCDCGMAKLSTTILNKKTALNDIEYEDMKKHSAYSYKMVQNINLLSKNTKLAIIQHHERLDGSGYPFGHKGSKIHPYAKIIAVADTFHAMISERLYRKKQSPFKVLELMQQDYFGKFDIKAINAISHGLINFSIGNKIKLSNGQIGEVLFMEENFPTRPLIKTDISNKIIDLKKNNQLFIEEVLTEF